jgi:hypothetical protein
MHAVRYLGTDAKHLVVYPAPDSSALLHYSTQITPWLVPPSGKGSYFVHHLNALKPQMDKYGRDILTGIAGINKSNQQGVRSQLDSPQDHHSPLLSCNFGLGVRTHCPTLFKMNKSQKS